MAAALIAAEFQRSGDKGLTCFAAFDCSRASRKVLLTHPESSPGAPLHVFGNLLTRVPDGPRQLLVGHVKRRLKQWRSWKRDADARGEHSTTGVRMKQRIGRQLLRDLQAILGTVEFSHFAWSYRHNAYCPVRPRIVPGLDGQLWLEVAGSVCKPWNSFGKQGDWLGWSSVATLVWLYSLKFYEPDLLLHECTPRFEHKKLLAILNERLHAGEAAPRSPWGRYSNLPVNTWSMRT